MSGSYKSSRKFHIFDARAMRDLPWRYYTTSRKAINAALVLIYWLEVGNTYTVYNAESSTVVREFTRTINGVKVME